jgi:2-dehydro-3-deoxy-D-arabinonate dehydratase
MVSPMSAASGPLHLYRFRRGAVLAAGARAVVVPEPWDALLRRDDLPEFLAAGLDRWPEAPPVRPDASELLAPIGAQEVWAAGVTYYRSRDARMEESKEAGGGSFYDRVYAAERPELFFKATPHRVAGHRGEVRIRRDARWSVPEPELTLVISAGGRITGWTIGNDMSSRDIEGENPLYLPQAKVYDGCCALGPGILVGSEPLPAETSIELCIRRRGDIVFEGATSAGRMKRRPEELASWLFRESSFPDGVFLLTGTGVVPPNDFTLAAGDEIEISIPPIGTLVNTVARAS